MVNPDPKFQDKKRYVKVKHGGASFIAEPSEAQDFIDGADYPSEYTTTDVWLTPYEFRKLHEFSGF